MADWTETLLPASFAGIDFLVENGSGGECGRRHVLSNYPFSDRFSVEDLGRHNAAFTLRAFILDNDGDLHTHHEQLFNALNAGEHTLVHPRLGRMQVLPGQCSYTFQGSRVTYNLQFLPPQQQTALTEQEETASRVDAASDAALDEVQTAAAESITTDNQSLLTDATTHTQGALDTLRNVNGQIDAALAPVAELSHTIDQISDQAVTLIRQPATLFNELRGVYYSLLNAASDITDALESYRDLRIQPDIDVNAQTPTAIARNTNRQNIATALNAAMLFETVRLVALRSAELNVTSNEDSPFDSYQHAIAVRDELVLALDELISTLDSQAYDAVIELRARFYRHIDAHGMRLPRTSHVRYGVPLPIWVIAHDVYGDATLVSDLVRRNDIAQPVYIKPGVSLEILRHD